MLEVHLACDGVLNSSPTTHILGDSISRCAGKKGALVHRDRSNRAELSAPFRRFIALNTGWPSRESALFYFTFRIMQAEATVMVDRPLASNHTPVENPSSGRWGRLVILDASGAFETECPLVKHSIIIGRQVCLLSLTRDEVVH